MSRFKKNCHMCYRNVSEHLKNIFESSELLEEQPMKTSLILRLPEELRMKIRKEAKHSDMSINQYVLYTLTKEISYKEAERGLKERIRKAASREEALSLLESIVPDVPALSQDELPSDHIQVLP